MSSDQSLIDERELARVLQVKVTTIRKWRLSGRGPGFVKIGRCVRYERETVHDYISQARRKSTSEGCGTAPAG